MYINTFNSKIHIPKYACLLSVNVTLFFYVSRLNHCQIFCVTYSLVRMFILNSLFCCLRFASILFLKFSIAFSHTALFINLHNPFSSLSPIFFLLLLFFVYWIQHTVWAIEIDWILISDVFFIVLILASSKVSSFHNESHTFLYQKS